MTDDAQLEWEGRMGRLAAGGAFLAAALTLAALVYQSSTLKVKQGKNTPATDTFLAIHQHGGPYVVAAIIGGLGTIALAGPLYYLFRATRARLPQAPQIARVLSIAGPIAAGVMGPIGAIHQRDLANQFARSGLTGAAGEKHAKDLQSHLTAVVGVGLVASLALAFAFVVVCLFAMRAGLLSRFMGILGIALGALTFLPGFSLFGTLIEILWLPALGLILLDRWPNGRGPAWGAVEAIPWPSARAAALSGGAGPSRGQRANAPAPEPRPADPVTTPAGNGATASPARSRSASKKRKRKRRG